MESVYNYTVYSIYGGRGWLIRKYSVPTQRVSYSASDAELRKIAVSVRYQFNTPCLAWPDPFRH